MTQDNEDLFIRLRHKIYDSGAVAALGDRLVSVYLGLVRFIWRSPEKAALDLRPLVKKGYLLVRVGQDTLGAMLQLHRNTIAQNIRKLEELGWVHVAASTGKSSVYVVGYVQKTLTENGGVKKTETLFADLFVDDLWEAVLKVADAQKIDTFQLTIHHRVAIAEHRKWGAAAAAKQAIKATGAHALFPGNTGDVGTGLEEILGPKAVRESESNPHNSSTRPAQPTVRSCKEKPVQLPTEGLAAAIPSDSEEESLEEENLKKKNEKKFATEAGASPAEPPTVEIFPGVFGDKSSSGSNLGSSALKGVKAPPEGTPNLRDALGSYKTVSLKDVAGQQAKWAEDSAEREKKKAAKKRLLENLQGTGTPKHMRAAMKRLERTWRSEVAQYYPKAKIAVWEGKVRGKIRYMLDKYDEAAVNRAIVYLVRNWEVLKVRFKRTGMLPNIHIMHSFRDQFVNDAAEYHGVRGALEAYHRWKKENKGFPPRNIRGEYKKAKAKLEALGLSA
jgi:hypothetical protein